jgi:nitrite reductase (NADH) large subunit
MTASMPDPILVVGAGIAGVSAAEAARAAAPGTPVVVLSKEATLPCYRLRLVEMLDGAADPAALRLHPVEWYAAAGIDLRLSTTVVSLVPAEHRAILSDGSSLPYSALVLASGSASFLPPVEGVRLPGVFTLWALDDALALRAALDGGVKRAVVIGGGLLGLECAYRMSRRGVAVTIVEMVPRLLPNQLDPEGSRFFEAQVRSLGIAVRTGAGVACIEGPDRATSVVLQDGSAIPADLVLFAAGVRPNLGFLAGSGVATGKRVSVDDAMRTNLPGVFAAGDVAEVGGRWDGLWLSARAQGRVAGVNAAGGDERVALAVAPYFLSTMETRVASVGSIGAGRAEGFFQVAAPETVESRDEEHLVYKRLVFQSGALVGAVLVGDTSAFQRIQAAVRAGMPRADALAAGFL